MNSSTWRFLAFLILVLSGCSDLNTNTNTEKSNTGASTSSQNEEAPFNQAQVLADYKDTPLTVLDISERNQNGKNVITITLSVPIDPSKSHQDYFEISDKNKNTLSGAWVVSASGKTVSFPFTGPSSTYHVSVLSGLVAANNSTLIKNSHQTIKTNELTPVVSFDTQGAYLTQGLGNGIPVVTLNVEQVDINFYRIHEKNHHEFLQQVADYRYYWGLDRITQFGDLAYTGRFAFDAPKNTRVKRSLDIEGIKELQESGVYLAVMTQAGKYQKQQLMWFSVTDIGTHARFYNNQLDVFASSLKTGQALANIDVTLVNNKGQVLQSLTTNAMGRVTFNTALDDAALIIAQNQAHLSLIEVEKPALDLSEFDLGNRPSRPQEVFIYSPRDLYRPGEVIDFNALLRDQDGRMVQNNMLNAKIKSPDGTTIKRFTWQGNTSNYFHQQWQIPSSANLGNWQLQVETANKDLFTFDFKVEDFLPERLKLTFNPDAINQRVSVNKTQTVQLDVLGEYLFGAPAAGNRLSTDVSQSLWRSPVESLPDFEFGDARQTQFNEQVSLDDITMNEQGYGVIAYRGDWAQLTSPLRVRFVSSLFESGGRPVSRSYSALVWPAEKMLGIRAGFGDNNPEANSRVNFEIVKADLAGKKYAASALDVRLIREDRRYFWVHSEYEGWHYKWTENEYVELNTSLDITDGELANVEFPVTWGHYRLEVRDPNAQLLSSKRFYAGWNWYENWKNTQDGASAARPDKVTMALDKQAYQAGDTAKVRIVPPEAGEALVMVEGDQPLWLKRMAIPAEGITLEIPIASDWQQHNLYISTVVLKPSDNKAKATAKRSFGLIHLPLDREPRKLNIEFDVVEKSLPNQTLPVTVRVNQNAGGQTQPSSSMFVTLAAVDVGVLSISDFETPDPAEAFFGQRRYQVDSRDVYDKVIELSDADKARLRFGGDSDLSRGGKEPQADVQIVSLFSGLVKLDNNGEAQIPVELPDFNGRVRLMAVAFSEQSYGSSEAEVTIAAPVVSQIAMPRFIATGDKAQISLDLTNVSGEQQPLAVSLSVTGNAKAQEFSQQITLADGKKETLTYPITTDYSHGNALISLKVSGDNLEQAIDKQWHLGIRPAYPAVLTRQQKLLKEGQQLTLDRGIVSQLLPDTIEASMTVSSTASFNLQQQMQNLLQYPYGCLEQTSSRAYPLIYATPSAQQAFHLNSIDEAKRADMINKGIERLASLQLATGGFGLWDNLSSEEHWLTAYVTDFLLNARDSGVDVPPEMLNKALKRLQQYVARSRHFYNERWSQDSRHYNLAYKAYAAYVLAKTNQISLGKLRTLTRRQSQHARTGLPLLHLAIAMDNMGDKKASRALLQHAISKDVPTRREYLGDYGSQIRDKAMMIHLLIDHSLHPEHALAMSFEVAELLADNQYLSTQERNALFLAGMSLQSLQTEPWTAQLLLNKASKTLNRAGQFQQGLTSADLANEVTLTSQYQYPLLASFTVNGYPKKAPAAVSNGMTVNREWLTTKGKKISSSQFDVGDLVLVHLQVFADKRLPDALVVDLIPAGFELENQNLSHAIKMDEFKIDGKTIEEWQMYTNANYQEYRDDRFVSALEVSSNRATHLFYLMRAVTPGEYKVPSTLAEDMYRPNIRAIGPLKQDINIVEK